MNHDSKSHWDWAAAALIIATVFTAAVRLDTTDWTPDLGYVESLAVLGTVLGLVLGLSRFRRGALRWMVGLYSIFVLPLQLSRIIQSEHTAYGQLASLGGRLYSTLSLLLSGKPIEDYIFFVTLMGILFWFVGIYSGYWLIKNRAILHVLLPSTIPILVIQYYDGYKPDRIWGLALYFFLALMLAGRINLLNSRERWIEQRVVAGDDPEFDLNKNIVSVAAVIILLAWLLPAPGAVVPAAARAWHDINQPFETVRSHLNDILAALKSNRVNSSAAELYGNVMGLGRTAGTGESELFSVKVPQNNLPRLYWRMRAYDTYTDGSWQTFNTQSTPFDPNEENHQTPDFMPSTVATFTFKWQSDQSTRMVTPSQPVWTSRTGSIQTISDPGGENDILSWSASPNIRTGDQYLVRAMLENPTQKELRASGSDYPTWIKEHYLLVPASLAGEYKQLAEQITAGSTNNYDKAEAVTDYLRQNITYSDTIPVPPEGVEPMIWFLFSQKSGFCNYYASAEVLLLRSVGIPARLVVGFAQGQSGEPRSYTIRGQDAHAWPEVFFPGIGWVQFEPTVNQAVLVRPSGEIVSGSEASNPRSGFADGSRNNPRFDQENDPFSSGSASNGNNSLLGNSRNQGLLAILFTLAVIVLGILSWRLQHRESFSTRIPRALTSVYHFYHLQSPAWLEQWMRWSQASPAERAFHAVNQSLSWLDKPQPGYATPAERSMLLRTLLPEAAQDIDILHNTLERNLFTPEPIDAVSANRAGWRLRLTTVRRIVHRKLYGE